MKTKFSLVLIIITLIVSSCKREVTEIFSTSTISKESTADTAAYFLDDAKSTPPSIIATKSGYQDVYINITSFKSGHFDTIRVSIPRPLLKTFSAMYANGGNQFLFTDTVGVAVVDVDGDPTNGLTIPIRVIFKAAGTGYRSGTTFNLKVLSLRIKGTTYANKIQSKSYLLLSTKPKISLEKTAVVSGKVSQLVAINVAGIGGEVIIDTIPLVFLTSNSKFDYSSLKIVDGNNDSVGKVIITKKTSTTANVLLNFSQRFYGGYQVNSIKFYLKGIFTRSSKPASSAYVSLDSPSKFVYQDDTQARPTPSQNQKYLIDSPDYQGSVSLQ